jgi:uncharacterized Tic20 family protein
MNDSDQRKLFSVICHAAIFLSSTLLSIAVPIALLFISNDSIVKANAKESLNFHINLYIYGIIAGLLTLVLIGFPLLILLVVISIVMPIIAIIQVLETPEKPYRYPFIFRLL